MPEPQQTTQDPAGIARTQDGSIAPSQETTPSQTTNQSAPSSTETQTQTDGSTTQTEGTEGGTLLNQQAPAAPTGAPEAYANFTVPETFSQKGLELDPATIDAFKPIAKELNLTQEQAQKLVDFYAGVSSKDHDANLQAVTNMRKEWVDQVKADPDLGPHLDTKVKPAVGRLLSTLGANEAKFREAMDLTGVGDHPAFIKAIYAWAQKLGEGTHVAGRGPSPLGQARPGQSTRPSIAEAMYPNLSGRE